MAKLRCNEYVRGEEDGKRDITIEYPRYGIESERRNISRKRRNDEVGYYVV